MKNALLSLAGFYCFAFAAFHLSFWKVFRWKSDLHKLTPVNRGIMQVLNLRLTFVFIVAGAALLLFQDILEGTNFGKFVLVAMSLFWLMRAIEQIIFWGLRSFFSNVLFIVFLVGAALPVIPLIL
jgi:hypothetical protein